jgi:hypothetical protein
MPKPSSERSWAQRVLRWSRDRRGGIAEFDAMRRQFAEEDFATLIAELPDGPAPYPTSSAFETELSGREDSVAMKVRTRTGHHVTVTVHHSGGTDAAAVVQVETDFAPDGTDGGPGLRIVLHDDDTYVGVPFGE